MGRAADAATLVAAALFVGMVVSWLAYAAGRSSGALDDDPRGAAEPQLRRAVPMTISVLFVLAAVVMLVLSSLAGSSGQASGAQPPAARGAG